MRTTRKLHQVSSISRVKISPMLLIYGQLEQTILEAAIFSLPFQFIKRLTCNTCGRYALLTIPDPSRGLCCDTCGRNGGPAHRLYGGSTCLVDPLTL